MHSELMAAVKQEHSDVYIGKWDIRLSRSTQGDWNKGEQCFSSVIMNVHFFLLWNSNIVLYSRCTSKQKGTEFHILKPILFSFNNTQYVQRFDKYFFNNILCKKGQFRLTNFLGQNTLLFTTISSFSLFLILIIYTYI